MKNKVLIICLGVIFLLGLSEGVLGESCVWKKVYEGEKGSFQILFEDEAGSILVGGDKVYFSGDGGDTFEIRKELEEEKIIFLDIIEETLVVGTKQGLYFPEKGGTWVKFFVPMHNTSFKKIVLAKEASIFFATNGEGIFYKKGVGTEDLEGKELPLGVEVEGIFDLATDGTNLWVALKKENSPDRLTYYFSLDQLEEGGKEIGVTAHLTELNKLQAKDKEAYVVGKISGKGEKLYSFSFSEGSWEEYPIQIDNLEKYYDYAMFSEPYLALVKLNDGSIKVLQQTGGKWEEYGKNKFLFSLEEGKDLLKTQKEKMLMIGTIKTKEGKKDVVLKCKDNKPPIADAGENKVVYVGEEVILNGSGSRDLDGDEITYKWKQIETPVQIKLKGEETAQALFIAPEPGKYSFLLYVSDGYEDDYDKVKIKVIEKEKCVLELEAKTGHHKWLLGKEYEEGIMIKKGEAHPLYDFAFKVYGKKGKTIAETDYLGQGKGYFPFYSKPLGQEFVCSQQEFSKVEVYLRTDNLFGEKGDNLTVRIRKKTIEGEILAEKSQFVPKLDEASWVEFVFDEEESKTEEEKDSGSVEGDKGKKGGGKGGGSSGKTKKDKEGKGAEGEQSEEEINQMKEKGEEEGIKEKGLKENLEEKGGVGSKEEEEIKKKKEEEGAFPWIKGLKAVLLVLLGGAIYLLIRLKKEKGKVRKKTKRITKKIRKIKD